MDFNVDFLMELSISGALIVVLVAILVNTLLGVFLAVREGTFDIRILPQFLATSVLPYVGGLIVLAIAAGSAGAPFVVMFYAVAVAVLLMYVAKIKDKINALFGISI